MQGQEKITNWLDKFDLSKFQLRQYKNIDEYEHRSLGYSNRTASKVLEVTYNISFNYDLLVTHLQFDLLRAEAFTQLFEVGQIEASCLTNRGLYIPVIRNCPFKKADQSRTKIVTAISITQSLKMSLLLKKDFMSSLGQELNLKRQRTKTVTEENVFRIISHTIKAIKICGYYLNMNTSASELIPLLNISQAFKFSNREDEAAETDILVSLSLISARRFVQASQLLRKVSRFYVNKYITSKSSMDFTRIDRSWIREEVREPSEASVLTRNFTGRVLEGGRYLYKAAKVQLLLAQTINQPSLLGEKLEAYSRATAFANGNPNPEKIDIRVDYEQLAYRIGPSIMPFLLKVLGDRWQILNVSSLKSIEFFFQILGCAVGGYIAQILKTLISIYPLKKQEIGNSKMQENSGSKSPPMTNRSKLLLDHMNHLLQSLLSLLTAMNKKYLKVIFQQIVLPSLSDQYRNQLRLYLLRIGEKILQICGPDLQISIAYIKHVFAICQGKYSHNLQQNSKHISHNLTFFAQKVLDILKTKVLKNYQKPKALGVICSWIHQTLVQLCENQSLSSNSQLNNILDMIIAIYPNTKRTLPCPLDPIIYLLNTSLYQPKMPFQKILQALIILINKESDSQLGNEIIQRIMARSKMVTLNLKQLKILQKVLQVLKDVNVIWLQEFLACIPHSNFDQIYTVFDMLVIKCLNKLDKQLIFLIINTLFNQYTVKGKAHQQSKELLISNLIKQQKLPLQLLLEICLFDNKEPKVSQYESRSAVEGQHCSDTKLYKLDSELFVQKINLLLLIFSKNEILLPKFSNTFTTDTIIKIYCSCRQLLLNSFNFKIKSKILVFIKELIFLVDRLRESHQCSCTALTFFVKTIIDIMNSFVAIHKDSKLHYHTILSIGLALQQLSSQESADELFSEDKCRQDFMDQPVTQSFTVPLDMRSYVNSLVINQLLKLWPNLSVLLNSPWENVREILLVVLIQTLKQGFFKIRTPLKSRLKETLKPLLVSFLQSNDHTQRLMAVKIVALLLGAGRQLTDKKQFAKNIIQNWSYFRQFMTFLVALEDDWNDQVSRYSKMISRVCLSSSHRQLLLKRFKMDAKTSMDVMDSSLFSIDLQEQMGFSKKQNSQNCFDNIENMLRIEDDLLLQEFVIPQLTEDTQRLIAEFRKSIEKVDYFNMNSMQERDSFAQEDENYFDPNDQKHSEKDNEINSRSDQQQLEFQDLGIIELDDEEWGEEESEVKITQKLPLKKVYKLSPNLGSSSKHHRIRSKRYHNSDFQEDKIIIDEIQAKISIPPTLQLPKQETKPSHLDQFKDDNQEKQEQVTKNGVYQECPSEPKSNVKKQKQKKTTKKRKSSTIK